VNERGRVISSQCHASGRVILRVTNRRRHGTRSGRVDTTILATLPWLVFCLPAAAGAFVTLRPPTMDPQSAVRWTAAASPAVGGAGLYDGIQVAAEPELAEKLAMAVTGMVDPADVADIEAALQAAFAAWENSVLRFQVELDGPAERGSGGREIDVFAVPESDPIFQDNDFFGRTDSTFEMVEDRVLTDGTIQPGFAFVAADIYLNLDMLAAISTVFTREQQPAALQRLIMHEAGHGLGFGHPNQFVDFNYDTDFDPLNEMVIDPRDSLVDLMLSPNVNLDAVMSNFPATFPALLFTELTNDERGGRDALYPGPPSSACPADCDGSGTVTIDEVVQTIRIGSGLAFFLVCPAADRDGNLRVTIDEIVQAVQSVLDGCPGTSELVVDVDWLVTR